MSNSVSSPSPSPSPSSSSSSQFNSFEFITSLSFNKMASEENYDRPSEKMACADELFQDGHLLPLPPRLQTPGPCASSYKAQGSVLRWSFCNLSFKKDVDPFMAAAELVKKEDMPWRCSPPHHHHHHRHRRTMSMDQPFITSREEYWRSYNQQMVPLNFNNMARKMKIIGSIIESKASNGWRSVKEKIRIIVAVMKKKKNESTGRLVVHHNRLGKPQVKKINGDDASGYLGGQTSLPCSNLFGCFRNVSMSLE